MTDPDRPAADTQLLVSVAVRTSNADAADIVERELGDLVVTVGEDAVVGDLVLALGGHLDVDDATWVGLELADRTTAEADARLVDLPIGHGDRLVVVASFGERAARAAAFLPQGVGEVIGRLVPTADGPPIELMSGVTRIGRSADDCDVVVDDPSVSRRHAVVTVGATVTIEDLDSLNGVFIDGVAVSSRADVQFGSVVHVGDVELVLRRGAAELPDDLPATSRATGQPRRGVLRFDRPPVVVGVPEPTELLLPDPPRPALPGRLPWLSASVPVVLAAVLMAIAMTTPGSGLGGSYAVLSAVFLLMSPIMMLAAHWEGRRSAKTQLRREMSAFDAAMSDATQRGIAALDLERSVREAAHPPIDALRVCALDRAPGLWSGGERFDGSVRLGSARIPSMVTCRPEPSGLSTDPRQSRLGDLAASLSHHDAAPFLVDLNEMGVIGVLGPPSWRGDVVRAVVLRLATTLPPGSFDVAVLVGTGVGPDDGGDGAWDWDWLKWLPHRGAPDVRASALLPPDPTGALEADVPSTAAAVSVLIVDGAALDEAAGVVDRWRTGGDGFVVLWLGDGRHAAPSTCDLLVERSASGAAAVAAVGSGVIVEPVEIDRVDGVDAVEWARSLAPLLDGPMTAGRGSIPAQIGIGDLLAAECSIGEPAAIVERWTRSVDDLRAPLGRTAFGDLTIDLRADGPHGVIAGTTGAGKSELLQSLVASFAANHPPSRVTFLLIDYKGGAAFGACVGLPHCVGLVTDLDDRLVTRVLVSLRAELRRRETVLASAEAKDLATMEERGHPDTPPSLVIIVDEFASLATEVPGFIDGMIDIARRGRSLGIHLLLATQRPAGVVSDQLRANTNLRIALRVAEAAESTDVVGAPDAASIPRTVPGRAVARLGHGELVAFQAAYCGGRSSSVGSAPLSRTEVSVRPFALGAASTRSGDDVDTAAATDLQRLVTTISDAAALADEPTPRRPWLDPLPPAIPVSAIADATAWEPEDPWSVMATVGMVDEPERQSQRVMRLDLSAGPTLVLGAGPAPADLVRTLVATAVFGRSPADLQIDVLDDEVGSMRSLTAFPQVGSVVEPSDTDRVSRLVRQLRSSISRPRNGRARRVLVIHDLVGLVAAFDSIDGGAVVETVARLAADGQAAGVHLLMTADRRIGIPSSISAGVGRRVVMAMASPDDYVGLGVDATALDPSAPGRALMDGLVVQTAALDPSGPWSLDALAAQERLRFGPVRAPRVGVLPDTVEASSLSSLARPGVTESSVLVGISDHDLAPVHIDLRDGNLLIAGPMRSGRTSALGALAASLVSSPRPSPGSSSARPPRRLLVAPRSTPWSSSTIWDDVGIGADAVALLDRTRRQVESADDDLLTVVFVDDATDVDDDVDRLLAELAELSRRRELRLVVAAESALARGAYGGLVAQLRRERRALLLQPDVDLDGDLAGVRLARRSRRPPPPGRGELVERGRMSLVQVAMASHALLP